VFVTAQLGLIGGLSDNVIENHMGFKDLYRYLLALVIIEALINVSESAATNVTQN